MALSSTGAPPMDRAEQDPAASSSGRSSSSSSNHDLNNHRYVAVSLCWEVCFMASLGCTEGSKHGALSPTAAAAILIVYL